MPWRWGTNHYFRLALNVLIFPERALYVMYPLHNLHFTRLFSWFFYWYNYYITQKLLSPNRCVSGVRRGAGLTGAKGALHPPPISTDTNKPVPRILGLSGTNFGGKAQKIWRRRPSFRKFWVKFSKTICDRKSPLSGKFVRYDVSMSFLFFVLISIAVVKMW